MGLNRTNSFPHPTIPKQKLKPRPDSFATRNHQSKNQKTRLLAIANDA